MSDWNERVEKFSRWSTKRIFWTVIGIIAFIVALVTAVGFVGGWFNAAKDVVSPANVQQQYQEVINDWNSLQAASSNACAASATKDGDAKNDPVLVEDPSLAYQATYKRIAVDYNRRQANIFEAQKVGPSGYPKEVPITTKDWCGLTDDLLAMRS